jgi:hypothetical protein
MRDSASQILLTARAIGAPQGADSRPETTRVGLALGSYADTLGSSFTTDRT